ncbi:NINE protein [Rhodobacterales bacterium HKCCE2091]|nr:NINE protein [Rhodobacterales bacterium HKCCE2091]
MTMVGETGKSPKSYGTAVLLCGIFGTLGIHHFYLGDWMHGVVDLGLFVLTVVLLVNGQPGWAFLAIAIDVLHTITVFALLIMEKWKDGDGRPVTL